MLNLVERVARAMAVIGGIVLIALVLLTCLSVLGRGLNTFGHSPLLVSLSKDLADLLIASGIGPVNGDFELLEAGVAFSIFSFLPICQIYSAHATVDIFTSTMSHKKNLVIKAFWEVVLTAAMLLITWRLYAGMMSKMSYGEITFLLQFPIWWAYAASLFAAVVASLVGLYCAFARVAEMLTGRHFLPYTEGAVH